MDFDRNDYLNWYIPRISRHHDAINLHSSGVSMVAPQSLKMEMDNSDPFGTPAVFETEIAKWHGVSPEEIVFTPGATGGTLLTLLTLCSSDGNVVVESPIYEPMLRQAERLAQVRRFERRYEEGWRISLQRVRESIDEKTSLVMVTEPHNPSGVLSKREDILLLAELAKKNGAFLLINEVYRGFTDNPSYHGESDNIVVVSSLSKLTGIYWARAGWLMAKASVAEKLRRAHLNMGIPTSPGAAAGITILKEIEKRRASSIARLAEKLDIVDQWVRETPNVEWFRPDAIGFGCISFQNKIDDLALSAKLLEEKNTLLVPGTCFEAPGTARLSWIQSGDALSRGLEGLAEVLSSN